MNKGIIKKFEKMFHVGIGTLDPLVTSLTAYPIHQ
jgi:hypothetical protein